MVLTECSGCAWNRGGAYVSAVMVKVVDAEPELLVEASTGAAVEQSINASNIRSWVSSHVLPCSEL